MQVLFAENYGKNCCHTTCKDVITCSPPGSAYWLKS